MTVVITNVTIGRMVKVEVCDVVFIHICPVNCNNNLNEKLIENNNIIFINDGMRKLIKAVIIVKIIILFILKLKMQKQLFLLFNIN